MKRLFSQLFLIAGLSASIALGIFLPGRAAAVSYPYDPSYLVNEKLFEDSGAMSVSDIQTFLNNEGSGIRTLSAVEACSPTTPVQPYSYTYFPHCGKTESAATLIYDAAHAYSISPRVILATMQKEEQLITDPTPWQNNSGAVNCAMGDTEGHASCADSPYRTFFSQVDNGTWHFRQYIESMNGRTWWGLDPSTYPCLIANAGTGNYNHDLIPGNTVTFANPGGTAKTVRLDDSATAALYCYTPYVGPQYTTYGYAGTGYSGSFNFVIDWDQWWGSSQGNYFDVASQSSVHQSIEYGHTTTLTVVLDNTSVDTWYSDDCAGTGTARPTVHPYRLMTPGYTNTPFADTSANVTTSAGSKLAWLGTQNQVRMIDCSVAPGATGRFLIPLKAPGYSTTLLTQFELVQDGVRVHGDDVAYFYLSSVPDYAYSVVSDNVPPGIYPGDGYQIIIKLKNTGGETWYKDGSQPGGDHPMRLATSGYANSPFAYPELGTNWLTQSQITMSETSVAPGSTGTFQAIIYAPYKQLTFNHAFRLVHDGDKFISGPAIASQISIPAPVASYSIVSKSGPTTMTSGQTATFSVTLKNTGNMIWRNVHRKVAATSTELPLRDVRMITWSPGYHTSYFWYTTPEWMGTHNQLTPATAIAGPGKTATYSITFHAPTVSKKTFFNEQWTLALDGQTVMPFQGLTFPITVNP